jgi:hypothetical protein
MHDRLAKQSQRLPLTQSQILIFMHDRLGIQSQRQIVELISIDAEPDIDFYA